jgi:signal transduction histidine kinase
MSVSHSIRGRSAIILVIAVVGFLLIVSSAAGILLTQGREAEIPGPKDIQRTALANNAAVTVEGLVAQGVEEQRRFIDRQKRELIGGDVQTVTQLLRQFTEEAALFSSEAYLVRGGTVFASWPENPDVIGKNLVRDFEHLREAQDRSEPSISGSIPSPIFFDQPAVEMASPVIENRRVEAIFASGFLVEGSALQTHVEQLAAGPGGFFFIVDGELAPIAYPKGVGPEIDPISQDKIQAHAPISGTEWMMTARQDRSLFDSAVNSGGRRFLGLLAALIIGAAILGYLAYRFLRQADKAGEDSATHAMRVAEIEERLAESEQRLVAAERERSIEQERVEQLDAEKDEFVSMVSHELRGPLTIMKGWVEMILERRFGELTEQQHDYLSISQNNIERMFALVEDLLTVSKAESGRLDMLPEQVSMAEVIGDLASGVEQILEERGLRLDVEVDPNIPSIEADRHRVEQVITNFLSNAIKFTPEGGTVTMRARSDDGGVMAEIVDTGLGIPIDEQADLFKKFFRTSNVKGRVPGTGLGLAISKAIVERHGGRVGVESVEGQGSTFWMWLPGEFKSKL